MRNGILAGGNWIVDYVKIVDSYPEEERLVNILSEFQSNGGSAYNILKDLAKLQADFPLSGIGLVGDDDRGKIILDDCEKLKINSAGIKETVLAQTSYTDVMTAKDDGKRTFFHHKGANALLGVEDFNFSQQTEKIFHLGYLLLLDKLDKLETDGISGASIILKNAKKSGFLTSADLVSELSGRFENVVPCSLPYIDYLFVNEFEAGMITKLKTTHKNGNIIQSNCIKAASKLIQWGVKKWVILHFPEGVLAVSAKGDILFQPCIQLPQDLIAGAVGAGDALAAGVLLGVHNSWEIRKCLELGVCAAATCLMKETSSDGILSVKECFKLLELYGISEGKHQLSKFC